MLVKLAELLLRRKELQQKVDQLKNITQQQWVETKVGRTKVTDDVDNIIAQVARVPIENVTHAYDWHAKRLRLVDAEIQQLNWTTEKEVDETLMAEYISPKA